MPETVLDYFVVDVFTETPLAGNPLAVVLNTCGLTTERMKAIAREFNLSETTFIERKPAAVERAEGVRVRIFTTKEELRFAGHPTLGTASVLRTIAHETFVDDTVTLALGLGPVPVRFEPGAAASGAIFGEMTQSEPEFGAELDAGEVAPLLGLAREDLDSTLTPQVVSTGTAFAIVVLRSLDALQRLKVDQEKATAFLREREREVVLCSGSGPGPKRGLYEVRVEREDAVLWRRGSSHGFGGGMRDQLPGGAGSGGVRCSHPRAAGCRDRTRKQSFSVCKKRCGEGHRCARWGQHCSCGKRTAFPAVIHMLSTEIHHRKLL